MITFLPYQSFKESARCLDRQRLGKQRPEVLGTLRMLEEPRMRNHPLVRMWRGYEPALIAYGIAICNEWRERGYVDNCLKKLLDNEYFSRSPIMPDWLGDMQLHGSHRSQLLAKLPSHYERFGWIEEPGQPYYWPVPPAALGNAPRR